MEVLRDTSRMPYGKHKGQLMGNISAKDLLWLYDNNKAFKGVKEYVEKNKDVLQQEVKPKRR